jgi:hypothetical protein
MAGMSDEKPTLEYAGPRRPNGRWGMVVGVMGFLAFIAIAVIVWFLKRRFSEGF